MDQNEKYYQSAIAELKQCQRQAYAVHLAGVGMLAVSIVVVGEFLAVLVALIVWLFLLWMAARSGQKWNEIMLKRWQGSFLTLKPELKKGFVLIDWFLKHPGEGNFKILGYRYQNALPKFPGEEAEGRKLIANTEDSWERRIDHDKEFPHGQVKDPVEPNTMVYYSFYVSGTRPAYQGFFLPQLVPVDQIGVHKTLVLDIPKRSLVAREEGIKDKKKEKELDAREAQLEQEELSLVESRRNDLNEKLQTIKVLAEGLALFADEFERVETNNSYDPDLKEKLRIEITNWQEEWVTSFVKK